MKVGIIGCGLIGRKRALALENDDVLVACCDINSEIGEKFSNEFNCKYYSNYIDLISNSKCKIIIVSVINIFAKDIVLFALKNKCNVLVEKPMGINYEDSCLMFNQSTFYKKILRVGFNHRYHPAFLKAKSLFDSKSIGELMFIRGIYGHGGRPGMEKEWRSSKNLCGGGELLDQGVHLINLSIWFSGYVSSVFGKISTKFWDIEVEDNAFMTLTTLNNVDIQLQASWTNWKNTFQFEIFGSKGYLKINGLGGSYGEETLEFGERKNEGGVPNIEFFKFDSEDNSWLNEWKDFKNSINNPTDDNWLKPLQDSFKTNEIVDAVYKSSLKNKIIKI